MQRISERLQAFQELKLSQSWSAQVSDSKTDLCAGGGGAPIPEVLGHGAVAASPVIPTPPEEKAQESGLGAPLPRHELLEMPILQPKMDAATQPYVNDGRPNRDEPLPDPHRDLPTRVDGGSAFSAGAEAQDMDELVTCPADLVCA